MKLRFLIATLILSTAAVAQTRGNPSSQQNDTRPTGLIFLDEARYRSIPLASTPLMGILPPNVDMSNLFPPPGNQGEQGSCVGWAVAYALKSYQQEVQKHWALNTTDHVFSPAYIYNQLKTSGTCQSGISYVDALDLLRREGVSPWNRFPYDSSTCVAVPDSTVKSIAAQYAVADWRRVNVQDETEVKNELAAGFPVLAGIVVDPAFFHLGNSVYAQFSGQNRGGHAVALVGYDDNKGGGAFKIINSWGANWGDGGYGWISYGAFQQMAREGYVVQDIVPVPPGPAPQPVPGPQPSPQPTSSSVGQGLPTVAFGVTFTHPATGIITQGIYITPFGSAEKAVGKTLQLVARFTYAGHPLLANPSETTYRDVQGLVASSTPPIRVQVPRLFLTSIGITIPYSSLNLIPQGAGHNLVVTVYAYLDNYLVSQSLPAEFHIPY
jgi:hypothetical protein